MNNPQTKQSRNILLFLCNWGAHAAFLALQDQRRPIPNEIRMVRTPCTGRIDRAMMLKAFAKGADGVALVIRVEPGVEPFPGRGEIAHFHLVAEEHGIRRCDVGRPDRKRKERQGQQGEQDGEGE